MREYLDKGEAKQFSLLSTMVVNNYRNVEENDFIDQRFKNRYSTPMHTRELILQCNNQNIKRQSSTLLNKIINTKITRHAKALVFDKIWDAQTHLKFQLKKNWATSLYKFDYNKHFGPLINDRKLLHHDECKLIPVSHQEGFEILYRAAENFVSKHRNVKFLISNNNLFIIINRKI